jgi:hypothetical protein
MQRTKGGFLVNFDTTKAKKYSDKTRAKVCKLKEDGLSTRQIATRLNMPPSSVYNIIRAAGLVNLGLEKVDLFKYIDRATARDSYDISWSSFDYFVGRYTDKVLRANGKVYIEREFILDRTLGKEGYRKLDDEAIIAIQDATIDTNKSNRAIAKELNIDACTVAKYRIGDNNVRK